MFTFVVASGSTAVMTSPDVGVTVLEKCLSGRAAYLSDHSFSLTNILLPYHILQS